MIWRAGIEHLNLVNSLIGRDVPDADMTPVLAEPLHWVLIEDESVSIFLFRGIGRFEVHVAFAVKGRRALDLGTRMLGWMKERGAVACWTLIPHEDQKVKLFTRWMGWKSRGVMKSANGPQEYFEVEL